MRIGNRGRRVALVGDSKDLSTAPGPKLVQGGSAERPAMHDALGVLAIHDLPGFSDRCTLRQGFSVEVFKTATAPDALHGKRFKNDGFCICHAIHFIRGSGTPQFLLQSFRGACP